MKKTMVIGIAGGSASGKTSISRQLKEIFEDSASVSIIRQDDYYKDQSDKTMEERIKTNYDHPFAFDNACIVNPPSIAPPFGYHYYMEFIPG